MTLRQRLREFLHYHRISMFSPGWARDYTIPRLLFSMPCLQTFQCTKIPLASPKHNNTDYCTIWLGYRVDQNILLTQMTFPAESVFFLAP